MKKFYIEMLSWNVAGQEIWPTWSYNEQDNKHKFAQYFERAWLAVEFDSPKAALTHAKKHINPDHQLVLSESESEILIVVDDVACMGYKVTTDLD